MRKLRITIGNKSYEVTVEDLTEPAAQRPTTPRTAQPRSEPAAAAPVPPTTSSPPPKPLPPTGAGAVTSPMAGSIKSIMVNVGDEVKEHQALIILEAMKMENQISAPVAGKVQSIEVSEGETVGEGHVLILLE